MNPVLENLGNKLESVRWLLEDPQAALGLWFLKVGLIILARGDAERATKELREQIEAQLRQLEDRIKKQEAFSVDPSIKGMKWEDGALRVEIDDEK